VKKQAEENRKKDDKLRYSQNMYTS
jgi:hypothetical protein